MMYVGIDPGKDGAIAYITENGKKGASLFPKTGNEYNILGCEELLKKLNPHHVVFENNNYHAAQGRQGAGVMGEGRYLWIVLLTTLKIPFTLVTPQTWQKEVWVGVKVQYKATNTKTGKQSKDTKATSALAAGRLFPGFDFTPTARANKLHDGMIDAMLMAEYCRRKFA